MQLTETQIYDSKGSFIIKRKPNHINKFIISKSVMIKTKTLLLESGVYFQNRFVFWGGTLNMDVAKIDKVVSPPMLTTPMSAKISDKGIEYICNAVKNTNEFLFAQVQGHSGRAFDSSLDHEEIFKFDDGFISIGVPNYGANLDRLENCEVFEYSNSQWVRLAREEISKRFEIW